MKKLWEKLIDDKKKYLGLFFIAVFWIIIVVLSFFLIHNIFVNAAERSREEPKIITHKLYSLEFMSSGSAYFILGTGTYKEQYFYLAYEELDDSGKKLYKMDANKVTIYNTLKSDELPYSVEYLSEYGYLKEIKLFIPQDTIKKEIDMSFG